MPERLPQVDEISIGEKRTLALRESSLYLFRQEIEFGHPNMWEEKSFDIGDILTLRYIRRTPTSTAGSQVSSSLYCQAVILRLDLEPHRDEYDYVRKDVPIDSYYCLYNFRDRSWKAILRDVKYDSYIGHTIRVVDGKGMVENVFTIKERPVDERTREKRLERLCDDLIMAESRESKELELVDFFLPPLRG